MSAAHLYIFGWSQIKFSEVETEELRFGEQCVGLLMYLHPDEMSSNDEIGLLNISN